MATDFAEPGKKGQSFNMSPISKNYFYKQALSPQGFAVLARPIDGSCQKELRLVLNPFKSSTKVYAIILKTLLSPRVTFSNIHLSLLSVAGFDPWQH